MFEFTVDLQILKNVKVDLMTKKVEHPWGVIPCSSVNNECQFFSLFTEFDIFGIPCSEITNR